MNWDKAVGSLQVTRYGCHFRIWVNMQAVVSRRYWSDLLHLNGFEVTSGLNGACCLNGEEWTE